MSESIEGNPQIDKDVEDWVEFTEKLFYKDVAVFKNLNQQTLREVKHLACRIANDADYYRDHRNEQGRGGLSSYMKKIRDGCNCSNK